MELIESNTGGPDTHDELHKMGAAGTAVRLLLVQKTLSETLKSLLISFCYKLSFLHIENKTQQTWV